MGIFVGIITPKFDSIMKKFLLSLCALILFSCNLTAQDDLDDIFDDGDSNSDIDIAVGTDLITLIAGTFNVYGEFDYKQKVGLQIGLGVVPFGYSMDFSRPALFSDDTYGLNRNIKGGFYYNVAFKYIQSYSDAFKWYYYGEFKRWSMTEMNTAGTEEIANLKKLNGAVGTGYAFKPFDYIGFDAHLGIFLGLFKETETGSVNPQLLVLNGFDLGIGAYYNF
jgi:hypothetical protein